MKSILARLILACALASASSAQAQIIAINFDGVAGNVNDTTGVVPVASAFWNNLGGTNTTVTGLTETDGTSSSTPLATTSITYGSPGDYLAGNPNLGNLLNGYLDGNGGNDGNGTISVSLTNIPFAQYDVYAYVGSDHNGRTSQATIGAETLSFTTSVSDRNNDGSPATYANAFSVNSDPTAVNPAVTTLLFTNVSGSSFSYSQVGGGGNTSTGLFGIEIVEVPEPGTWAMMGLGALVLAGLIRRKAATV